MLSEQDKSEIRKSYRNAIDPRQQVKILSQLYLVSREEILDILGPLSKSARPKPSRKGQPRRIYAPEFKAEAMERLRSGESFRRVAEDMGVNVRTMATWAYQMRRKEREKNAKLLVLRQARKIHTRDARALLGAESHGADGNCLRQLLPLAA